MARISRVLVAVVMTLFGTMLGLSSLASAVVFGARKSYYQQGVGALTAVKSSLKRRMLKLYMLNNYLDFDNSGASGITTTTTMHTHNRVPIVAGNWKLNPSTVQEASALLNILASNFVHHRCEGGEGAPEVIVFPPSPFLERAVSLLEGTGIKVGAQNVGLESGGAFTGEVSPSMVRSLGCDYIMVGHSERRTLYGETDETINAKIKLSLAEDAGLSVILCVGETLEEYENDLLECVVNLQLKKGLQGIESSDVEGRLVVAYEPVWAIGTGKVATPQQAQVAHEVIRSTLAELYGPEVAQTIQIQYGGSVTPDSIEELMAMPDVDGALVGGASLTADSFSRIVDGATTFEAFAGGQSPALPAPLQYAPKELSAREVVSCKNVLGESPIWSVKDQVLYWISAPEEEVWTWNLKDAPYRRLFGTTIGCIALKASDDGTGGNLLVAGESAFLETRMTQSDQNSLMDDFSSATETVFCDRPEQTGTTRPNDGRVDREGRLVVGMYNNYHRSGASEGENNCGLYRLCPVTKSIESIFPQGYKYRVSNCIAFSPDGRAIYFCDTPTRKVYAFDYPESSGEVCTNRRLLWTMPPNLPGGPDGAQVDADGGLWMALSGAGMVVRVHPSNPGVVDCVVRLPVKSPTSCTFGGPELDELFITTRGPDGGGLYRVKMPFGIRGLPEPEFGGGPTDQQLLLQQQQQQPQLLPSSTTTTTTFTNKQQPITSFGESSSGIGSYLDTL
jgi:triosephosphate isomerase